MKKRNLTVVAGTLLTAAIMLTACGGSNTTAQDTAKETTKESAAAVETTKESAAPVSLTVMTNMAFEQGKILSEIFTSFTAENTNIKVEDITPGKGYEDLMKVKMASNDMPDLFSTHGWAKIRYADFVADLKDRAWAKDIDPGFKPNIADETGKVYTLAFDQDKSGIIYNVDIFNQYGIEVPKTIDEFMAACETIKTKSNGKVTPIACATEGWEEAQYFDYFATSLLITPKENSAQQLLDGSFDWNKWTPLAEKWQEMYKKGYINKNMLTAKYTDNSKSLGEGTAAIGFYGAYIIDEAKKVNPNVKLSMMPIPAWTSDDTPTFAGGEKSTLAVWKDSKNLDAALKLIDFCAKPENVEKMCAFTKLPPALTTAKMNAGEMQSVYEKFADLRTMPYFDRVYLANGMWDVMCKNSASLIGGASTPQKFSENMKNESARLRAAQQK